MNELLEQIEKSLNSQLYYLALFSCLALPDICGALESRDGNASGSSYIDWFNRYVKEKYKTLFIEKSYFLTGEDCYYLRCSFLHQGSSQHNKSNYSRIAFIEPEKNYPSWHNNISEDVLQLDIGVFCNDIITGVKQWLNRTKNDPIVQENIDKLLKRYPNGIEPHFVGLSMIS